jgi:hypothetical protein
MGNYVYAGPRVRQAELCLNRVIGQGNEEQEKDNL